MAVEVHTSRNAQKVHGEAMSFQVSRPEGVLYVYGAPDSRGDAPCIAVYAPDSWEYAKIVG